MLKRWQVSNQQRLLAVLISFFIYSQDANHAYAAVDEDHSAQWIWSSADNPSPKNRFTYFRNVVSLDAIPVNAELRMAADTNARLWINGHILRRKVARYHEAHITAEVINAAPYLRVGKNVVVVLHHNWGDIITFQRTGNKHAGLYIHSNWVKSDASWRCITAPQMVPHEKQILGRNNHPRIRYPQIIDARKELPGNIHEPDFDDRDWQQVTLVKNGPWLTTPRDVETPGQQEYPVHPMSVLAAGNFERQQPLSDDPLSIATGIRLGQFSPNPQITKQASNLIKGRPTTLTGRAGESQYITVDFGRPIHGYPFLAIADATEGTRIDLGYGELYRSQYDGRIMVQESGWIDPEGVVGKGYSDRCITRAGRNSFEIPDERTARWMTVVVHFQQDGSITFNDASIVRSQYPLKFMGSFACGNDRIEQIVKLCLIHAEITMTDAYVDTPGREDGQWIEDARPRALLAARWFGDVQLRRLMIRTLAQGQGNDGHLHPFAPSNFDGAYPATYDWSVQWVAMIYDDYMWTGKTDLIREYWPNLCKYWDRALSHMREDGLWQARHVLADIRVGVRCHTDEQSSGIVTPGMIERLHWSAEMADAIDEKTQAEHWRSAADKMAEAFRQYHIVPAAGGIPAHVADRYDTSNPNNERGYSQAGQTVAITTGLLTREQAIADLNYALPEPDGSPPPGVTRWNNPSFAYRVLRTLSETGLTHRAVAHLLERFSQYLPGHPNNPTPLKLQGPYGGPVPEYWISREDWGLTPGQINTAQPEDDTGSHSWGAVPLLWLHDTLLGVQITSANGRKIRIAPDDGGLPYVEGYTLTPQGLVWVHWNPQQMKLEVTLPDHVLAEVILPPACRGKRVELIQSHHPVTELEPHVFRLDTGGPYVFQAR